MRTPADVAKSPVARPAGTRDLSSPARLLPSLLQNGSLSQATDPLEQEADRVARQVMAMTGPDGSATTSTGVARDAVPDSGPATTDGLGTARPLDPASRAHFEPRFGLDFGHVRIFHDGNAAVAAAGLGARAFTRGRDIAFADGEYAPQSERGRRLLAHELTHVAQAHTPPTGTSRGIPPIARHRAPPGMVCRAEPEAETQASGIPFDKVGNEAGAAGARHAATRLEGLLSGTAVRSALATIPITDAQQKQIVIDHILNAPAALRAVADADKVRVLSQAELDAGAILFGFPKLADAFADAGNDFLYITPHGTPNPRTMGHEISHIQTGPVSDGGADPALSTALGKLNTEVRAAYVDYAIVKLAEMHKDLAGGMSDDQAVAAFAQRYGDKILEYIAAHGSVSGARETLAVVVAARRGAEHVPTNTSAFQQAVAKGFVSEADLESVFSRETNPFDVEPEPFKIEGQ